MVVARTVAMLVNEAVDLVARGEATAEDVDTAMRLGTGYPMGPLEWGDARRPFLRTRGAGEPQQGVPDRAVPSVARTAPSRRDRGPAACLTARRRRRHPARSRTWTRGPSRCGTATSPARRSAWSSCTPRTAVRRLRMPVRDDMVQGHGSVHGGIVFALGDSAFAFCCNGPGQVVVGASADVTWVAPAKVGDVLIADGEQEAVYGRSGVTRVRITRESDGALVALFQGRSRQVDAEPPVARRPAVSGSSRRSATPATHWRPCRRANAASSSPGRRRRRRRRRRSAPGRRDAGARPVARSRSR